MRRDAFDDHHVFDCHNNVNCKRGNKHSIKAINREYSVNQYNRCNDTDAVKQALSECRKENNILKQYDTIQRKPYDMDPIPPGDP